jgi:hypothetical protein
MTDQVMDVRDFLIQQHEQERMRQQIEAITQSDEDRDRDAAAAVERHAAEVGQECHNVVSAAEDSLIEVSSQARSLRGELMSGTVSREDAIRALQDLHKQRDALLAKIKSAKNVHASVARSAEDPAAAVASLRQRFPSLNG